MSFTDQLTVDGSGKEFAVQDAFKIRVTFTAGTGTCILQERNPDGTWGASDGASYTETSGAAVENFGINKYRFILLASAGATIDCVAKGKIISK